MAGLARKFLKIFGVDAPSRIGVFGSFAEEDPTTSVDPEEIQSLDAWGEGWDGAIPPEEGAPALQDFNGYFYLTSYQLAYLLTRGVPDWNALTTYNIGDIAKNGTGSLFRSLQDTNLNHALTDTDWWYPASATGGLTPIERDTSGTIEAATLEECDSSGGPIVRTLPPLPLTGQVPISVVILDATGDATDTNYIDIAPHTGQSIADYPANDTLAINTSRGWVGLTGSPGASSWVIQTQSTTYVPPASPSVSGYVTTGTQSFAGNKTFGNGASVSLQLSNNGYITSDTTDGADNRTMLISGGGGGTAWTQNRGAGIVMNGNEVGGAEGELVYYAGNSGGSFGRHRWVCAGVNVGNIGNDKVWTLGDGTLGATAPVLQLLKANATNNRLIAGIDAATRGYVRINSAQTNLEFEAASDRRIKTNIKALEGSLEKIKALKPCTFNMKSTGNADVAFIAQEFAEVFPEAVTKTDSGEGEELPKGIEPWSMSNAILTVHLVRAIQEQQAQIENLSQVIESMKKGIV
jgi:hypothetical protein